MHEVDLIIIGAGPAGMSAAWRAAECGLSVLILDEQPAAGGQIYRDVDRASALRGDILGKDFTDGQTLTRRLDHVNITHLKGAVVWQIEDGPRVSYTQAGQGGVACAKRILLATGALERPMPLPGWTLPGVMTAGAAQILLKQSGIACERAVLVGSGPLLYLIAAQMVRAGVIVNTVVAAFNLFPIPPLDGSHVMRHLVGMSESTYLQIAQYGFIILIVVINVTPLFQYVALASYKTLQVFAMILGVPL